MTILPPMHTHLRLLLALWCVALTLALAAPVWAQPASPSDAASEPGEPASDPAETASPGEDAPDPGEEDEDDGKIQLPLDLEDKQDLLGLLVLGLTAAAGAVALRGAVKQLRGDHPKADGTWRPR